jgi:hypothetical protein
MSEIGGVYINGPQEVSASGQGNLTCPARELVHGMGDPYLIGIAQPRKANEFKAACRVCGGRHMNSAIPALPRPTGFVNLGYPTDG